MEGEGLRASLQKYFLPPLTDKLLVFLVVIRAPLTESLDSFRIVACQCCAELYWKIGTRNTGSSEGWMLPNPQPHPPVGYKMLHEPAMSSAEK